MPKCPYYPGVCIMQVLRKKKLWTGFVHTKNTTSKMSNVQFWGAGFNTVLTLEPFFFWGGGAFCCSHPNLNLFKCPSKPVRNAL